MIFNRVNLIAMPVKSSFFQLGAICVWPPSTERPPMPGIFIVCVKRGVKLCNFSHT